MDKIAERETLQAAIGPLADDAKEDEAPDFLAQWAGVSYGFEVTEFFPSQTSAKMRNKPEYGRALIQGRTSIHSRDVGELTVDDIQWHRKDGPGPTGLRAVIQQLPPKTRLIELLQEQIEAKEKKAPAYRQRCDHVDLVIRDKGGWFVENDPVAHISTLCRHLDLEVIRRSMFREISLVTDVWPGGGTTVVPLKTIVFLSDCHAIEHLMREHAAGLGEVETLQVYLASLAIIGHGSEFAIDRDGTLVLTCGMNEVCFAEEGRFVTPQDVHRAAEERTQLRDQMNDFDEETLRRAEHVVGLRGSLFTCVPIHVPVGDRDSPQLHQSASLRPI